MRPFLLVDFGTTSVKSAIVDLDTGAFSHIRSHPSAPNCAAVAGHYEMAPLALQQRFRAICDTYYNDAGIRFEGILICSEQNGFLALDVNGSPIANYVSWKDERSLEPIDGLDTFSLLTGQLGERFKSVTGWRPGPGLPFMNVTHMGRQSLLRTPCKLVTLPEWLASCCDDAADVVHDTMLHGLGFYDVRKGAIAEELVALVEHLTGVHCTFNPLAPTGAISGYWHSPDDRVPIYAGIGDHQCSVLGAGNSPRETISVNIGTGSQVAVIGWPSPPTQAELRPFFDGDLLSAITRIPGGRALAGYIGFLEDVCRAAGREPGDFWQMLHDITEANIAAASLNFDLAIFGSAWGFSGGGRIEGILEGSFLLRNYLASLLKSLVRQYAAAMQLFDPQHTAQRCLLSGGVARRLPVLSSVLAELTGYQTSPASDIDESLLGLRTIALLATGCARHCVEAARIFGQPHDGVDKAST